MSSGQDSDQHLGFLDDHGVDLEEFDDLDNERESNFATSDFHDIEDDDVVLGKDEDVDEPEPPNKRTRVTTQQSAEQWIADYNQQHPLPETDANLQRFQGKIGSLILRVCEWANSSEDLSIPAWMQLNRADRETTRGFRNMLMHADPAELTDEILHHMPFKAQEVLGRKGLTPVQLLDMPAVPGKFLHRLTYFNIPVRVGKENIKRSPSVFNKRVKVKTIAPDAVNGAQKPRSILNHPYQFSEVTLAFIAMRNHVTLLPKTRVFIASSVDKMMLSPISASPEPGRTPVSLRMRRMSKTSHDAVFLEGLLMVYLGTYHRSHKSQSASLQSIFSEASYELVDHPRLELGLPDFHDYILNRTWPLMQGVHGGMIIATQCANPHCERPRHGASVPDQLFPDFIGTEPEQSSTLINGWHKSGRKRVLGRDLSWFLCRILCRVLWRGLSRIVSRVLHRVVNRVVSRVLGGLNDRLEWSLDRQFHRKSRPLHVVSSNDYTCLLWPDGWASVGEMLMKAII